MNLPTVRLQTDDHSPACHGAWTRTIRLRKGLTLDALSTATGLSKGHLSRFERGEKALSVAALVRVAAALDTSVSRLLGEELDEEAIRLVRADERIVRTAPAEDGGYQYAVLSGSGYDASPNIFVVSISGDARRISDSQHGGKEILYVLQGAIEVELAGRRFCLSPGDCLEFPGHVPHVVTGRAPTSELFVIVSGRH